MVFSSLSFIIAFLPALLILYFIVPEKWGHARQYILLAFSLIFYGSGEPLYILLILCCISLTFILSNQVMKRNKTALISAILINVIPLVLTKYLGFIISNINRIAGSSVFQNPRIAMPIGISFYTFQVLTYIVDLYRGTITRQKNIFLFSLYIMFFPQLIAGPIVKYEEIEKDLENQVTNWDAVKYGAGRFIIGLGKKVLIANQAGYIANTIMNAESNSVSVGMTWLCVFAYTIQIYFDFSGYSEMAIGLGSIFGFHFPENFKDPYTACSVTDFWRKWHMTLGRFFREYVYIPLGGNRVSKAKWIRNILIVWSLTGLWHGAAWNFIVWGIYYGMIIVVEKITGISRRLPKTVGWAITFFLVMIGWAIFMCDGFSIREMISFINRLFVGSHLSRPVTIASLKLWGYIPFLIIGFLFSTPAWTAIRGRIASWLRINKNSAVNIIHDTVYVLVFLVSMLFLVGSTYNPFIYFRF